MLCTGSDPKGTIAQRLGIPSAQELRRAIASRDNARANFLRQRIRNAYPLYAMLTVEIEIAHFLAKIRTRMS